MIHSATSLHTFRASRWLVFLLALIAATIMAACSPGTDTTTAVSTPTLAATAVSLNRGNSSPPTTTPTPTPLPPTHTPSPSDTPAGSPTAGPSPTTAPTETPTQTPTATPTSAPQVAPELNEELFEYIYNEDEDATPISATAVPTPVPTFEAPSGTTNILLLGSDTPLGQDDTRTDTIIIASINSDGPTASIVSIPRDLFVYIPGWTMTRINSAYEHGERKDYPDGGIGLLKQTILYNFGIPIHYYARVDFNGFQGVVDAMDGVDLAVSCEFTDWRLKSPELDVEDPENWEPYTLAPGMHHLDGDLALWYARSRLMSSDFDRGRRQQQLLQAMFNQGVDLGLVSQFPALWDVYKDSVDTDMDIGRMLQFAAMAPALRENGIQHLYLAGKTQGWTTPGGASVLLPVWEGEGMMQETFQRLFLPPALNRAGRAPMTVEIINATDNPDMAALAADNLAWYGFVPVIADAQPDPDAVTQLTYYGPNFKGSYDWLISWVFSMYRANIQLVDDVDYPYNYQVILGSDYDPCRPQMYAPQAFLEQ